MEANVLAEFLLWGLAFIFSATAHEASHAWAAMKGGDPTAYYGGQVTLDPTPHIKRSPFGMILVPMISFFWFGWMIGWASAPYDPRWANRYPHRAAKMALAGPASNFLIALIVLIFMKIGISAEWWDKYALFGPFSQQDIQTLAPVVAQLLGIIFILNIILGVFNLIPLPPLDGATGILIFFPEKQSHLIQEKLEMVGMFGIFIAFLIFQQIAGPILNLAIRLV